MDRLLALDTSSNTCSVALLWEGELFFCHELTPRGHMQRLLPMVDQVLLQAGAQLSQLEAIAFGAGPGSFTGLRVASGIVQGLAFGADIPIIPVSSLAILAQGFKRIHPNFNGVLGVAVDARMNEVYAGRFCLGEAMARSLDNEQVLAPQRALVDLFDKVDGACGSGWLIAGLAEHLPAVSLTDIEPDARDLLTLARGLLKTSLSADKAIPVYLRDSITWQKRPRIRIDSL